MRLTDIEKGKLIALYEENYTQVKIAEKFNVSQSTVSRIMKKYNETGDIKNEKSSVRPKVIDEADYKIIKKILIIQKHLLVR